MSLIFLLLCAGAVAGLLSGFFGVGGGLILVPAVLLMLPYTDLPTELHMHIAVGTSLTTILVNSLFSARKHSQNNNVRWKMALSLSSGVACGAILGGLSTSFIDAQWLTLIFCLFTVYTAINLLKKSFHKPASNNKSTNNSASGGRAPLLAGGVGIG